jgi:hypothetical protein
MENGHALKKHPDLNIHSLEVALAEAIMVRYLLLETGHVGQNLCLAASSLGLGSLCIGGFESEIYLLCMYGHATARLMVLTWMPQTSALCTSSSLK